MNWQEKIRKLTGTANTSELARSVGLYPSAITDAINKGHLPRADKAIRIAKALGVSCDWLFDDSQGWPPPQTLDVHRLPDVVVVDEALRRKQAASVAFHELFQQFRKLREATLSLPDENSLERWNVRLQALTQSATLYAAAIENWSRFCERWDAVRFLGDVKSKEIDEFLVFLNRITDHRGKPSDDVETLDALLDIWGVRVKLQSQEGAGKASDRRGRRRR